MKKSKSKPHQAQDNARKHPGRNVIIEMFLRHSAAERFEPILLEMLWYMRGCQNPTEHLKMLPDYCYEIFAVCRRTYFKIMPTLPETINFDKKNSPMGNSFEEMKQVVKIDWRQFGRVIGLGLRGLRFFELEAIESLQLKRLSNLTRKESEVFFEALVGKRWLERKEKELGSTKKCKRLSNNPKKALLALLEQLKESFSSWGKLAYKWSPKAMAEFNSGIVEGTTGFMNEFGQLVGESNRGHIYWFLLLAWSEIKEMQESQPLKTRNDLANFIEPFAKLGLVSIQSLAQLNDVCDDIHLKFKGRGAPKKAD